MYGFFVFPLIMQLHHKLLSNATVIFPYLYQTTPASHLNPMRLVLLTPCFIFFIFLGFYLFERESTCAHVREREGEADSPLSRECLT